MKIKLTLAAITLTTLGVVACQPTTPEPTYPFCAETTTPQDCIDVADPVAQVGWLITSDGTNQGPINYWLDGTIERH